MTEQRSRPRVGGTIFLIASIGLSLYFMFGAVQGPYGLFQRIQIDAEARALRLEKENLTAELAETQNRTRRMSDGYLDLDLLDEQARRVLGMARTDEIVVP